ncbi:hypothetical protein NL676_032631 [Syzygium grande]|nr:hypothetical protein NL676_032631 [Syzygium grande]
MSGKRGGIDGEEGSWVALVAVKWRRVASEQDVSAVLGNLILGISQDETEFK